MNIEDKKKIKEILKSVKSLKEPLRISRNKFHIKKLLSRGNCDGFLDRMKYKKVSEYKRMKNNHSKKWYWENKCEKCES
jgi:hypothetical protein